jgi:outer membrane protein assembly factor BamB
VWKKNISGVQSIGILDNAIMVVTHAKEIAALDTDGKLVWITKLYDESSKKFKNATIFSTSLVINDNIHLFNSDGELFILSSKSGDILAKKKILGDYLSTSIIGNRYYIFNKFGKYLSN